MNNIDIFIESVKNPQIIGAWAFSSKHVVKKMVKPIRFAEARCIVELGAGNGCITRALLRRMKPDTQLLSFEINKKFYRMTAARLRDSRLRLINDSAENMLPYIYESGFAYADYIVSSVPLVSLPKRIRENILNSVLATLKPNGLFIQLSYSTILRKKIERIFGRKNVKIDFTPFNFPPAFIYVCKHNLNVSQKKAGLY